MNLRIRDFESLGKKLNYDGSGFMEKVTTHDLVGLKLTFTPKVEYSLNGLIVIEGSEGFMPMSFDCYIPCDRDIRCEEEAEEAIKKTMRVWNCEYEIAKDRRYLDEFSRIVFRRKDTGHYTVIPISEPIQLGVVFYEVEGF